MDGSGLLLTDFISALRDKHEVKVIRYPTRDELGYVELERFAQATLPTNGPFALLGESFSGPIAISLAAQAPPGLVGLVLCCSFARNPRPLGKWFGSLVPLLPVRHIPTAVLSKFLFGDLSSHSRESALRRALIEVSPEALRKRVRALLNVDVSAKLVEVNVPVLYLRASRDRLVPRSASESIALLAPATQVIDIDAPHFLLQTAPLAAADAVSLFLGTVRKQIPKRAMCDEDETDTNV
jgi:pimeloyl-ACP methyl ester carboxylesterase